MEVQSKPGSGSLIGIVVVAGIILFIVMSAFAPGTRGDNAWQYLVSGKGASQQSQAPASGPSIVGGPSLSAQKIDTILTNAGSPAQGAGQSFYQDSSTYNIDDAVALAFFKHESSFGKAGAAAQTNNMGNIVCTAGYSCIGRFRAYPSWAAGIDDWYKLISGPAYAGGGLTTLSQILPKYAPSSDNNSPTEYIATVQSDVNAWRAS